MLRDAIAPKTPTNKKTYFGARNLVSETIIYAIMTKLHTRNQVSVRGFKLIKNRVYTFANRTQTPHKSHLKSPQNYP